MTATDKWCKLNNIRGSGLTPDSGLERYWPADLSNSTHGINAFKAIWSDKESLASMEDVPVQTTCPAKRRLLSEGILATPVTSPSLASASCNGHKIQSQVFSRELLPGS